MLRRGALVVSCEARPDTPLHAPTHMAAMARAAALGGAGAIRANGPMHVAAISASVTLPIIGLNRRSDPGFVVDVTPDFDAAYRVAEAGADIIAIDATARPRRGEDVATLIRRIREEVGHQVMAEISTLEEGLAAWQWGADYISTALAGRTGGAVPLEPDFDLVAALVARCEAPVVAAGRFREPGQVTRAFALGAHAVCVGSAITDPCAITRRFLAAAVA